MVRQAQNAKDAGDGDLELRRLRQFLAANPNSEDARVLLARYYEAHGLPDLALEHYRLAAAEFPNSQAIALSLAKTLRAMGAGDEAVRALAGFNARQAHPDADALSLQAVLEDELGRYAAAEATHRAAIAASPDRSDLHNNLGFHLLSAGSNEAAIAEFHRAIELEPQSEVAHNNLATALARTGAAGATEAVSEWSRFAGKAQAHNNLAAVRIEEGRYTEARAELASALAIDPNLPTALANLQLVAAKDGGAVTLAPGNARVKRSIWAKIFGKKLSGRSGESKSAAAGSNNDSPTESAPAGARATGSASAGAPPGTAPAGSGPGAAAAGAVSKKGGQ